MKFLIFLTLFVNYVSANYLFYCDEDFSNEKFYKAILNEKVYFELEKSKIKFTLEDTTDGPQVSLKLHGNYVNISVAKLDDIPSSFSVESATGKGVGRHGLGYKFKSTSDCDDKRAIMERYNIGGVAGGLIVETLNCICSVD